MATARLVCPRLLLETHDSVYNVLEYKMGIPHVYMTETYQRNVGVYATGYENCTSIPESNIEASEQKDVSDHADSCHGHDVIASLQRSIRIPRNKLERGHNISDTGSLTSTILDLQKRECMLQHTEV